MPPRSTSRGVKGHRSTRSRVSIWADIVVVGLEKAAATVVPPFTVADANEEVRFQADETELDNTPAARAFG